MSWLRIEGKAPQHPKIAPLSDAAFRLHFTAMCWCVEHLTDGHVPFEIPKTLTSTQRGKRLGDALKDLESRGLWHATPGGGWMIHDFLDWNPSAEETRAKRAIRAAAGAVGGIAKAKQTAGKSLAIASPTAEQPQKNVLAKLCPDSDSDSGEKRSPPTPSEANRPKPADPMAATWGAIRPDVLRVHDRYREAFGLANHKLRNAADVNAITIADAIDAHGEAACLLVLKYARADGMVSGKQDDKGLKHEKITYVLGNPDTFARILRNAEQSEGRDANRRPASELVRKALAL